MLRAVAALTLLTLLSAACEEQAVPQPGTRPKTDEYVGVYAGAAGEAKTTIAVEAEEFDAVVYTPAVERGAARAAATASDSSATWWEIAGTTAAPADRTVTLKVATVQQDDRSLEGAELARYTACTITAPTSEALGEGLLEALMKCLGVTEPVEVVRLRQSIIGSWEAVAFPTGRRYGNAERTPVLVSDTSYTFPAGEYWRLEWVFRPVVAPPESLHQKGLLHYYAMQFHLGQGGNVGYAGLQTEGH